jgi:hypothetical protein
MNNSPNNNTPELLQRDARVTQTDRVVEKRTMVVRVNKGGAATIDPRRRTELKQIEDLVSSLDRLKADAQARLYAKRRGDARPASVHNTVMCVPELVSLIFLVFPPTHAAVEETANV